MLGFKKPLHLKRLFFEQTSVKLIRIRFQNLKSLEMIRIFFLNFLLYLALTGNSQNSLDVFTFSGKYGFPQSYETTYNETASEYGTYLNLTVPVTISEKTIWYNSLNHFYFNVQGDDAIPETELNPIKINGFILRTGLYQKLDNGRGIQLLLVPRLMSDLHNIDGNSFQLGGIFMYEKVYNPDLLLSYGAMYNQELFGPYVVPILNIYWKMTEKWYIKGLFPVTLKVNYRVNENLTLGLNHFGLITSYYLSDPLYEGDYIERKSIDLSLFFRQKISGNFYFEGKAGRTFGRSYSQFDGSQKVDFSLPLAGFGDNRVAKNTTFNDGFFIDFGFVYNIQLDNR